MTSEVVIMNRRAIAIAADSAVTLERTVNGQREERYQTGANKLFEFSSHHPIGVMIYNSADLHDVPWEIVIKEHRRKLGKDSFSSVEEYALDFFSGIQNNKSMFTEDTRNNWFETALRLATLYIIDRIDADPAVVAENDLLKKDIEKTAAFQRIVSSVLNAVVSKQFSTQFIQEITDKFKDIHKLAVEELVKIIKSPIDVDSLTMTSFDVLFKKYSSFLPHTGIVFAGYGDKDYFPEFVQYDCYGLLADIFLADKSKSQAITANDDSHIETFAMDDMVQTFMTGISSDVYRAVLAQLGASLRDFAAKVVGPSGTLPATLDKDVADCVKLCMGKLIDVQVKQHYSPLAIAVGALPIDEMAGFAETLIMLESLKEKVTRPSQSVGGPIDVAVITKSEGLVWIKRKHYFPSDLNSRFLERQRQKLV